MQGHFPYIYVPVLRDSDIIFFIRKQDAIILFFNLHGDFFFLVMVNNYDDAIHTWVIFFLAQSINTT